MGDKQDTLPGMPFCESTHHLSTPPLRRAVALWVLRFPEGLVGAVDARHVLRKQLWVVEARKGLWEEAWMEHAWLV